MLEFRELDFEISPEYFASIGHKSTDLAIDFFGEHQEFIEGIKIVYPVAHKDISAGLGCTCGNVPPDKVYATVYDPIGFCEGIAHEAGHLRLFRAGLELEDGKNKILSNSSELSESCIRKDKLRPLSACLHGLYSYILVTHVDCLFRDIDHIKFNLPRVEEGLKDLEQKAKWSNEIGPAILEYGRGVVLQAKYILARPYKDTLGIRGSEKDLGEPICAC